MSMGVEWYRLKVVCRASYNPYALNIRLLAGFADCSSERCALPSIVTNEAANAKTKMSVTTFVRRHIAAYRTMSTLYSTRPFGSVLVVCVLFFDETYTSAV